MTDINVNENLVSLTIDNIEVQAAKGTLVVDAAKMVGINIPVFCYHPKMDPVGMCRMCLVEIGRPERDRSTGEFVLDEDGKPSIIWGRNLETGCTVRVEEGMVVRGYTEKVEKARKDVLEFLLTSHPLDCPVCDKGGECPLQNLTMEHGQGQTRFKFDEKKHNLKHVPLGDLIFLDRERCIHCARCIRFQDEIASDPVIGFFNRGRSTEIVTFSDPGFDSYFSGNTSDICPVGALTTADFRFGARPWELTSAASICDHCSVGCNLTYNVRREAKTGGDWVIKRALPRQNEQVNELWICDKGRFGYHYAEADDRLTSPMIRKDGVLVEASWDEALELAAEKIKAASKMSTIVSGRLANEDLFNLKKLTEKNDGAAWLYTGMGGGQLTAKYGLSAGSNLADLGAGDVILVAGSDLEEEAPLYWLRVNQAAKRGAAVISLNARKTKLDWSAKHVLQVKYGQVVETVTALKDGSDDPAVQAAAKTVEDAGSLVVFFGSDGVSLLESENLAKSCAALLEKHGKAGQPNNGLVGIWPDANTQGAVELGWQAEDDLDVLLDADLLYLAETDLANAEFDGKFVIVQDTALTETAKKADIVFPAAAVQERDGSFTNAERRVQRFYPALPQKGEAKTGCEITSLLAENLDLKLEKFPSLVLVEIAKVYPPFAGLDYQTLAEVEQQYPMVGREDLFYGGTSYDNTQGLGKQLAGSSEPSADLTLTTLDAVEIDGLLAVPVTRLYDHGRYIRKTELLQNRTGEPFVILHPSQAENLGLEKGSSIEIELEGQACLMQVRFLEEMQEDVMLVPRDMGLMLKAPAGINLSKVEEK